ncbi:MAG: hypothetical protein Fur0032_23680 [Terrimicrobiaceae bacterium]
MRSLCVPVLVWILCQPVWAQTAGPTPAPLTIDETIAAFSVKPPDEMSPFFADRELAKAEQERTDRRALDGATGPYNTATYPNASSSNSVGATLSRFFTDMFASIRFSKPKGGQRAAHIEIDPPAFSLSDRREVEVTYSVRNDKKKIMRLDYPTTQRIDIITTDSAGTVVDRWSDDRVFDQREGIVFINPGERIQYTEKIPTREMKAGETYLISGEVAGNSTFTVARPVEPTP